MCSGSLEKQQGVWPYELERRLHKLMETRQKYEIKSCRLHWKRLRQGFMWTEAEASWWKVTAYIVSEHIVFYSGIVIVKQFTEGFRDDLEETRFRHVYSGPLEEQQGMCPHELERKQYELSSWRQEIYYLENIMYA